MVELQVPYLERELFMDISLAVKRVFAKKLSSVPAAIKCLRRTNASTPHIFTEQSSPLGHKAVVTNGPCCNVTLG